MQRASWQTFGMRSSVPKQAAQMQRDEATMSDINLQNLSPLDQADLTYVLSDYPLLFLAVPSEILEWVQGCDETALLTQLINLILADRPILSANAAMVADAVNPNRMIDLLVAVLERTPPEQLSAVTSSLSSSLYLCQPKHLPLDHPMIQTLLRLLAEPSTEKRRSVVQLLTELGTKEAFDHVLPYLGDNDEGMYYDVVTALLRLDVARALPIVQPLLVAGNETLRWCVCDTLSEYPSPLAVDLLVERLRHDDSAEVRTEAAFALGVTGDSRAIPALAHAAASDPAVDAHGHCVDINAARSVVRILLRRLGEYVQSGNSQDLGQLLTEEFANSDQLTQLMREWQADQQRYGRLQSVEPVSYFCGGDPYTYFDALDPEFGGRASFEYEQQAIEYNILLQRSESDWRIRHIVRHA
ncbi:MAG: HEAT repeat domain-containing protein [Chloroflexi bacterium]|nr:HEAT repeat domain-containing protein [Chloroflexota bacterium]